MRTIKFRAKKRIGSGWAYGHYYEQGNGHWLINNETQSNCLIDPDTLGQFTGLHDKNGKEIYEGDILRGETYPYKYEGNYNYYVEIFWEEDGLAGFCRCTHKAKGSKVRGISDGIACPFHSDEIEDIDFEAIGNIYDNKDLIEE